MKTDQKIAHASQAERGSLSDMGRLLRETAQPQFPTPLAGATVANLPPAADYPQHVMYCTNGGESTAPILVFSDGSNWRRSDTGDAVVDPE